MRKLSISQAKTANVEVSPSNVTVNVTNVRPYTKTEMKTFSDVIRKAARAYELQMVKNCEVKLKCIEYFALQKFENINMFWTLYLQRADILLNSRRFIIESRSLNLDPVTLATNVVAHGSAEVYKVASFGIRGSKIKYEDYQCPIVPAAIIKRFMENPEDFYPAAAPSPETPEASSASDVTVPVEPNAA